MGMFKNYVSQTRKPEGFLGKMMLGGMNSGHAKLADWGFTHLPAINPDRALDLGCGGGRNAGELLKKYPHRSPFFHIKGYSEAEGYKAYVGRDDYDWNELLDLAINTGDAKIFNIEFGTKEDIDSWERAKFSIDAVLDVMKNM